MSERKSREQVPDEEEVWACVAAIPPSSSISFYFSSSPSLFPPFPLPPVSFARSFCPSPSRRGGGGRRKRSSQRLFRWQRFLREGASSDACTKRRRISRNSRRLVLDLRGGREKLPRSNYHERGEIVPFFRSTKVFEASSKDKDKTLTQLRATRIRRRGRRRR